jgi:hypothetical protein
MLGRHPVDVLLLATDLGVARRLDQATLGLVRRPHHHWIGPLQLMDPGSIILAAKG